MRTKSHHPWSWLADTTRMATDDEELAVGRGENRARRPVDGREAILVLHLVSAKPAPSPTTPICSQDWPAAANSPQDLHPPPVQHAGLRPSRCRGQQQPDLPTAVLPPSSPFAAGAEQTVSLQQGDLRGRDGAQGRPDHAV